MFDNCNMSQTNYDNLLVGWSNLALQSPLTLGVAGLLYSDTPCLAFFRRKYINETYNWTFEGDSPGVCILPSNSPTPTNTFTPTLTPTTTYTPSVTKTSTLTPTMTRSLTPTNTVTPSFTPSFTPSVTITNTPSQTPSNVNISIVQTDTPFNPTVVCAPYIAAISYNRRIASIGGTPGTNCGHVDFPGNSTRYGYVYLWTPDPGTNWNAGTWTWRLEICDANSNVKLEEVYICRVSSSNVVQSTIGLSAFLGITLSSNGVVSGNIAGSAQSPSLGDWVIIVFVFTNYNSLQQRVKFVPSQTIDTPFN